MPAFCSCATTLRLSADAIEQGDRALALVSEMLGRPVISGAAMLRADLLMLAAWLEEHPAVDQLMGTVLEPAELTP